MEVYIELAFLENFLIDGMLLFLALKAARRKVIVGRLLFASALGAFFAIFFPLLRLGKTVANVLKFLVGAVLCFAAIGEKGAGRYAMSVIFFYAFSFALGGALLAVYGAFSLPTSSVGDGYLTASAPVGGVIAGCFFFCVFAWRLIRRLHQKRRIFRFLYLCRVTLGSRFVEADGFLDSGNRASVYAKNSFFAGERPLNFLSPDLAYELLGDREMTEETAIATVNGEKTVKIFRVDRLEIYCGNKPNIIENVYFAPTPHIRAREYKILLNSRCFDGVDEVDCTNKVDKVGGANKVGGTDDGRKNGR